MFNMNNPNKLEEPVDLLNARRPVDGGTIRG